MGAARTRSQVSPVATSIAGKPASALKNACPIAAGSTLLERRLSQLNTAPKAMQKAVNSSTATAPGI